MYLRCRALISLALQHCFIDKLICSIKKMPNFDCMQKLQFMAHTESERETDTEGSWQRQSKTIGKMQIVVHNKLTH